MPVDPVAIEALAAMLGAFAKCDNLYGETELRTFTQSAAALRELLAEVKRLKTRMEIDPEFDSEDCDGIACRNDTSKLQDERIAGLLTRRDALCIQRDQAHEAGRLAGIEEAMKVAAEVRDGFLSEEYAVGQYISSALERSVCNHIITKLKERDDG